MNRRDVILSGIAATGAAVAGTILTGGTAVAAGKTNQLVDTIAKCIATGLVCGNHCDTELGKGNKAMAECRAAVTDMLATCEALQRLAARSSKHLPAMAKLTATVCADCAKACEPHAKHMEICKACMDTCNECEKACKAAA